MTSRRLAVACTAICFLLSTGVLLQQRAAAAQAVQASVVQVLRARAIELVDERGQARAQLSVEPNGDAVLRMRDSEGAIRVKLGASKKGSGLVLLDASTEPGVHVLAGEPGTSLTVKHGKQQHVIRP